MTPNKAAEEDTPLGAGLADQTLTPTPASAWKKPEDFFVTQDEREVGFVVELPSGNVIRMTRTLDMPFLLKTGSIPNPLAGIVQGMIDRRSTVFPQDAQEPTVLSQLLDLMNETAVRAIIEPQFCMPEKRGKNETAEQYQERLAAWEPEVGKVSVWDLTPEDRQFIFAVSQGAAADLARFREESEGFMAPVPASRPVPKPTKRTGGGKSKK